MGRGHKRGSTGLFTTSIDRAPRQVTGDIAQAASSLSTGLSRIAVARCVDIWVLQMLPLSPIKSRMTAALAVTLALLALSSPAAMAQTPPPTLTGETFLGGQFAPGVSTVTVMSANCNPGGTSTFTYNAMGPSSAPYLGTYSETGTVTIGPQTIAGTPPSGIVTGWTASFTITSSAGNVTGSKSLMPGASPSGICENGIAGPPSFMAQRSAATGIQNLLAYTAIITVPGGGQFRDSGGSDASVNVSPDFPASDNFFEQFTSQQATTTVFCDEDDQGNQAQDLDDQGCAN
jgi:hypothetical protein